VNEMIMISITHEWMSQLHADSF